MALPSPPPVHPFLRHVLALRSHALPPLHALSLAPFALPSPPLSDFLPLSFLLSLSVFLSLSLNSSLPSTSPLSPVPPRRYHLSSLVLSRPHSLLLSFPLPHTLGQEAAAGAPEAHTERFIRAGIGPSGEQPALLHVVSARYFDGLGRILRVPQLLMVLGLLMVSCARAARYFDGLGRILRVPPRAAAAALSRCGVGRWAAGPALARSRGAYQAPKVSRSRAQGVLVSCPSIAY